MSIDAYNLWRKQFQATRPHGARPGNEAALGDGAYGFKPRARTGRDVPGQLRR